MIVYLPFLLWFVLLLFSLLDIDRTPDAAVRGLSSAGWFLVVILVPVVGAVAWLTIGRPRPVPGAAVPAGAPLSAAPLDGAPSVERITNEAHIDGPLQAILDRIDREFDEAVRRSRERHRRGGSAGGPSDRR